MCVWTVLGFAIMCKHRWAPRITAPKAVPSCSWCGAKTFDMKRPNKSVPSIEVAKSTWVSTLSSLTIDLMSDDLTEVSDSAIPPIRTMVTPLIKLVASGTVMAPKCETAAGAGASISPKTPIQGHPHAHTHIHELTHTHTHSRTRISQKTINFDKLFFFLL